MKIESAICKYVLGFLFAVSLPAQTSIHFGTLEIPHVDANEIQIREGTREWRIDLTNLIRNNDCYMPYTGNGNERICAGPPKSPCPECPKMVGLVAWDERRRKLYFSIGNGGWQERPWTVFNYNLATHRVTRFTTTFATVMGQGVVSASGQYLAYVQVFHCSPAAEGHCASDAVEVMDLWNHRIAGPAPFHDNISIQKLTWSSPSKIEYVGSVRSFDLAQPERPTAGSIDVRDLQFH